jgi:pimeloyl-ACP methyl ester carboxylesterase
MYKKVVPCLCIASMLAGCGGAVSTTRVMPSPMASQSAGSSPTPVIGGTSTSAPISAANGGTLSLKDGTTLSIPGGVLSSDQTITLTNSAPADVDADNDDVVGPVVSIGTSVSSLASTARITQADATSPDVKLTVPWDPALRGSSEAILDLIDSAGAKHWFGLDPTTNNSNPAVFAIPAIAFNGVTRINFEAISAKLRPQGGSLATSYYIPPSIGVQPQWQEIGPGVSTLPGLAGNMLGGQGGYVRPVVLVHGVASNAAKAYPEPCVNNILAYGGYDLAIGYSYDWTQPPDVTGNDFAAFLDSLSTLGITEVDVWAHSYGTITSMVGIAQTKKTRVDNVALMAGPLEGTPLASMAPIVTSHLWLLGTVSPPDLVLASELALPLRSAVANWRTAVLSGEVAALTTGSPTLGPIRDAFNTRSSVNSMNVVLAAGNLPIIATPFPVLGPAYELLRQRSYKTFGIPASTPYDGIIPQSSALSTLVNAAFRLPPYPAKHTDFGGCTTNAEKDIATQFRPALTVTSPSGPVNYGQTVTATISSKPRFSGRFIPYIVNAGTDILTAQSNACGSAMDPVPGGPGAPYSMQNPTFSFRSNQVDRGNGMTFLSCQIEVLAGGYADNYISGTNPLVPKPPTAFSTAFNVAIPM